MELDLNMPVKFGDIVGTIYGGPFRKYEPGQRRLVGVKMAAEIDHPHDISIPTQDFSVPSYTDMREGIEQAIIALANGNDIYAGCMGGIGRTGLFMGCLAKVMFDYEGKKYGQMDTIKYVRQHYKPHAIETQEQQMFVIKFDTSKLVRLINSLQRTKPAEIKETVRVVNQQIVKEVVVEKLVYLSPWAWLCNQLQKLRK